MTRRQLVLVALVLTAGPLIMGLASLVRLT
jgi:hypothetical protein